ncbi:MAG: hypothetical protein ACE5RC_02350 [Nitrosopumilus sp.]
MQTRGNIKWDDGTPVINHKVEVWDADSGSSDDFVKFTTTDSNGNYSMTHKKKQDPWWYGSKKRGDFYIKIKNSVNKTLYKSKTYSDYKPSTLTIDVILDKIAATYGINTVHGKITARYPDERGVMPLSGVQAIAIDDDWPGYDSLGAKITDSNGEYVITFSKSDYDGFFEFGEGRPDIYVDIRQRLQGSWKKIWKSGKDNEAILPKKINLEIPVVIIQGKVNSYKKCRNNSLENRSITSLTAVAYDSDKYNRKQFLGSSRISEKDGSFEIEVFGTRDSQGNPNDIFVRLEDNGNEVWRSQTRSIGTPSYFVVSSSPIDAVLECDEEDSAPPTGGTAPTSFHLHNNSNHTRYIYRDNQYAGFLYPEGIANFEIPCGSYSVFTAKETISDTYNSVTYSRIVIGACTVDSFDLFDQILY